MGLVVRLGGEIEFLDYMSRGEWETLWSRDQEGLLRVLREKFGSVLESAGGIGSCLLGVEWRDDELDQSDSVSECPVCHMLNPVGGHIHPVPRLCGG